MTAFGRARAFSLRRLVRSAPLLTLLMCAAFSAVALLTTAITQLLIGAFAEEVMYGAMNVKVPAATHGEIIAILDAIRGAQVVDVLLKPSGVTWLDGGARCPRVPPLERRPTDALGIGLGHDAVCLP